MAEIKDSGSRREFDSGAVRDIQEGKGRCDLMPLDIIASLLDDRCMSETLFHISEYIVTGKDDQLFKAIRVFCEGVGWTVPNAILEVAIQYEDGAVKYGERNWEKGIPLHCYIDSGVRHLLKVCRGDEDEPHKRAFIWNMLGAIWTHKWREDLCDLPAFKTKSEEEIDRVRRRVNEIERIMHNDHDSDLTSTSNKYYDTDSVITTYN